jgi:hypothetical protein
MTIYIKRERSKYPYRADLVKGKKPYYCLGMLEVDEENAIQFQELSLGYLRKALPHIRNLAQIEGFPDHARSVEVRLEKYKK